MIESSSPGKIVYNYKEYLTRTIYELAFSNSPVYIRFHTHPSFGGAPGLSKLPFFVDGIEKIPSLEKSKFQVFKEAFIEGRKRARK